MNQYILQKMDIMILVLLSNEAYEQYEEKRIEDLINKHFNEKLDDFESFKKTFMKK